MCIIRLSSGSDSLTLHIHGRTTLDSQSYWDANWLHCTVAASAGAFHGSLEWQLRNEDLARFMQRLESLCGLPVGEALLDTGDGWLEVRLIRKGEGILEAECQLEDNTGGGSTLGFRLPLDEAALLTVISQVRVVLDRYPVIGSKGA